MSSKTKNNKQDKTKPATPKKPKKSFDDGFIIQLVISGKSNRLRGRVAKEFVHTDGLDEVYGMYGRKAAEGDLAILLSKMAQSAMNDLFRPKKKGKR